MFGMRRRIERAYPGELGLSFEFYYPSRTLMTRHERREVKKIIKVLKRINRG